MAFQRVKMQHMTSVMVIAVSVAFTLNPKRCLPLKIYIYNLISIMHINAAYGRTLEGETELSGTIAHTTAAAAMHAVCGHRFPEQESASNVSIGALRDPSLSSTMCQYILSLKTEQKKIFEGFI